MINFWVLPIYWIASVVCFCASSRQTIRHKKGALLAKHSAAIIALFCILCATLITWYTTKNAIESVVTQLFFIMFFLPASVIVLTHRPNWLKAASLFIFIFCYAMQLILSEF